MTKILDGREEYKKILTAQATQARKIASHGFAVGFTMLSVGEDDAKLQYALANKRACANAGINAVYEVLPAEFTTEQVVKRIMELNADPTVNGIMVLAPYPEHIDGGKINSAISPEKDVDGQTPRCISDLYANRNGKDTFYPCTPYGAIKLLKRYNVDLDGKNVTIVGRSTVVGKPMAALMLNENATVTICHTHTKNLRAACKNADIIVLAAGKANLLDKSMVREGVVVIDFGSNFVDGKVVGDADYDSLLGIVGAITPVPGGCGPMTTAVMLENIIKAAKRQYKIR
ncbi:MAG: tetrahydrofolate dehydrogenase/cyclohydrolase catalytic domain-containing protein [Clostridiales bacterium]|nr:tetrahydrofolate dehydrogenase/cyclohydrolase catalytic domain-containing protein [Clostridiales bacterium]